MAVDQSSRSITIAHEEIKGYMGAMTMPFTLKDQWVFGVVKAGDRVQATLVVEEKRAWLEGVAITRESSTESAQTTSAPKLASPKLGDTVPDFPLLNQDAKPIRFSQYRNEVLFLTFIYTRCPLPYACPKFVDTFAELNQELQKDPALQAKTHLLCISFDPTNDTPEVLRSYGSHYVAAAAQEPFAHWEFASGTPDEIKAVAQFFGLLYAPETNQIVHSYRTVVITPEGKIFKLYTDNTWTAADLLQDVRQVLTQ